MSKWPKRIPPLSPEQQAIANDFMHYWLQVLPKRFSWADHFGHKFVVRTAPAAFRRTLEVGAGLGEHLAYERLSPEQRANYHALDLRPNIAQRLQEVFPDVNTIVGDCQQRQPFPDGFFDRIVAIHVLEHLPDLPAAIREMHRLCDPQRGLLQVVIPCEGSWAYRLARRISAQRIFEKRYKQPYQWFISREHINLPEEIIQELSPYFSISNKTYFPIPVRVLAFNLFIAFTAQPRALVKGLPEDVIALSGIRS